MRQSRFTEERIIAVLKAHAAGMKAADVCRKTGWGERGDAAQVEGALRRHGGV
jgi:hypothetical protein